MTTVRKKDGGLGVMKLQKQNEAILVKNLHNFFNKVETPWVALV
jgi:hypothetical protein